MPPNARHSHELARPRLEFWVPAVAFQPIGPTLPFTIVQPLVRCEMECEVGRAKSEVSKQAEVVGDSIP